MSEEGRAGDVWGPEGQPPRAGEEKTETREDRPSFHSSRLVNQIECVQVRPGEQPCAGLGTFSSPEGSVRNFDRFVRVALRSGSFLPKQ